MASFVVETYVPGGDVERFTVDVDRIRAAAEALQGDRPARHVRSYLARADEMGFHLVEAPGADVVRRVAALACVEVERVVAVIDLGVDPTGAGAREGIQ